jgi:Sporulation and spore germination/Immunoglobulin-like domain of bacterial spore germination
MTTTAAGARTMRPNRSSRTRRPARPSRLVAVLTALAAAAVLIAACGPSSGGLGTVPPGTPSSEPSVVPGSPDVTPGPSGPSASPGGPSASPDPSAPGTQVVRAYFVLAGGMAGSEGLVATLHEVEATKAVATAAMNALLAGAPLGDRYRSVSSAIPAGTRLLGLTIRDGVATVDLSGQFGSGGGSSSVLYRLGQVVYTLTQFPSVTSVLFRVDGQPVTVFSSEGIVLDGPVGRADFEDQLPAIFVDRPAFGAAIGNPARITGTANVFEASFLLTILDGSGRVLAEEVVTATCGTGCRGTFDATIRYSVDQAQWGTLRAWNGSAQDGSPINVREYPVWLTP